MLDQIGLFSFIRLAGAGGTSTGLVHLYFYWTNSSLFQGPEALGGWPCPLYLSSTGVWFGFWPFPAACWELFCGWWNRGRCHWLCWGECQLIVLSFWCCFLCLSWIGKGKTEIEQDADWSPFSWEKVDVSLVWSWPPCCCGIPVALKGLPRVERRQNVWVDQEINGGRNIF